MEGKKLRKRGKEGKFHKSEEEEEEKKRENIEALYERLKIANKQLKMLAKFKKLVLPHLKCILYLLT